MRTAALLTAEDFALVAPVLGPCELIRGEIVPMSPGGIRHSKVTLRAAFLIETHNQTRRLGHVLTGEAGVVVGRRPDTVRGADVAFISFARLPKGPLPEGFLQQPPELVVEVPGSESSWAKMDEKVAAAAGPRHRLRRSPRARTHTRDPPLLRRLNADSR